MTAAAVRARVRHWRAAGGRVGFVPTMGNLHAGHVSLVSAARERAGHVVASAFVNPLQFGPNEDFSGYPRSPLEDEQLLAEAQCDLLFAPTTAQMYPSGDQATRIQVRGLSQILCGQSRPGHFDGVATVVAKLFGIVAPDVAVFGEKDYQQLRVVTAMARDLDIPTRIVGLPTVREKDGLAMSSRNAYLSPAERATAPALYRALKECVAHLKAGQPIVDVLAVGRAKIEHAHLAVDYLEARHAETLAPIAGINDGPVRLLVAARLGRTRLIDNIGV